MNAKDQLVGSATASSHHLEIELAWTNDTQASVWVALALPRQAGASVKPDPVAADVEVDQDRVVISRRLHPMPKTALFEAPEVPEWRLIAPGERYTGKMIVGWPLTHRVPYAKPGQTGALGTPTVVRCVIGTLPATDSKPPAYRPSHVDAQTLLTADIHVTTGS